MKKAQFDLWCEEASRLQAPMCQQKNEFVKLNWVSPPRPQASFGFVNDWVAVGDEVEKRPARLIIPFDSKRLGWVRRETLRLFRFDPKSQRHFKIHEAFLHTRSDVLYATIDQAGVYGLIGVNVNPAVFATIQVICRTGALVAGLDDLGRDAVHGRICDLMLCASDMDQLVNAREELMNLANELGEHRGGEIAAPLSRLAWPGETACQRCQEVNVLDLPECQILSEPEDEVCAPAAWESVGPHHISGAIRQVVIHPRNRRWLYAVSANGGIWYLNNVDDYPDTSHWRPLTDTQDNLRFRTLALAPSRSRIIYAANSVKGLLTTPNRFTSDIYRSDDWGDTWRQVGQPGLGVVHRLVVDPANPEIVLAASSTGLWRRREGDGGWSDLFRGDCLDVVLDPDDPSIIYLGVRLRGIFKSLTAGEDWSTDPILVYDINDNGVLPKRYESIKIALGRRNSDLTEQSPTTRTVAVRFGKHLCVSHTSGEGAWTRTELAYPSGGNQNRSDTDAVRYYEWCNCVAVDPFDSNHILTGGTHLEGSTDGGASLFTIIWSHPHEDEHSLAFDDEIQGLVYLGNDGGLYASLDGGNTWPAMKDRVRVPGQGFNLARGLATSEFRHSAVRGGSCLAAIDHTGLIICNDLDVPNAVWRFGRDFADPDLVGTDLEIGKHGWERHMVFACPASVDRYYMVRVKGSDHGKVEQLDISRTNGRVSGSDLVSLSELKLSVPPLIDPQYLPEQQIYLNYGAGPFAVRFSQADDERLILFGTRDLGADGFTIQSLRLPTDGTTVTAERAEATGLTEEVYAITFVPNDPDRAFAITKSGQLLERDFSTSGQFEPVSSFTLPANDRYVFRLVATHGPSLSLFALSQLAITRFDDDTGSWSASVVWRLPNETYPHEFLLSLVADPSNSNRLFLGTTRGVYLSKNRGRSFEPYRDGLPHVPITELTFDGSPVILVNGQPQHSLYAATLGRGLWRCKPCPQESWWW